MTIKHDFFNFNGYDVEIARIKGRRGLVVRLHPDRGIVVRTNLQTEWKDIESFLRSKSAWIERHMRIFQERADRFPKQKMREGEKFPYLGELKYLKFSETKSKKITFSVEDGFLICHQPQGLKVTDETFFAELKNFYKKQAVINLTARMSHWQSETGLDPLKLNFRMNKSRWGSCSSQKHISLNWKLICQSPALIDYVIVHELCHLKHMNHSSGFWQLVESHLPSYREIEQVLHDQEPLGAFLE